MKQKYRKAVFIVTYSKVKDKIYFLILKRKLHWKGWEFPKGGLEKGENIINTIKREVKEETGLKALKIKNFRIHGKYHYKRKYPERPGFIGQMYSLYSVEVKKQKVKVDQREHSDYKWLEFPEAIKRLTFRNQKECLSVVNDLLTERNQQDSAKQHKNNFSER